MESILAPFASLLSRARVLGCFAILAAAALPTAAFASRSNLPIGHEEPFMANTGTALVASPAAVFYNPAGLGNLESSSLSASGSSYYVISATGTSGDNDVHFGAFNSVPHTLISTWKLGPGSLAFSILSPDSTSLDIEGKIVSPAEGPIGAGTASASGSVHTSRTLAGLSWGQGAFSCGSDCHVDLGASLYFSYTQSKLTHSRFLKSDTGYSAYALSMQGQSSLMSLTPMIGALVRTSEKWSFGLRIEPPSIFLKKSRTGSTFRLVTYDNAGTPELLSDTVDTPLATPDLMQLAGAVGIRYEPDTRRLYTADLYMSEQSKAPEGGSTIAPALELGLGHKRGFSEKLSLLAGTKLTLADPGHLSEKPDGGRYLICLLTAGLSLKSNQMETIAGFFKVKQIELSPPKSSTLGGVIVNEVDAALYGLQISGLYRF